MISLEAGFRPLELPRLILNHLSLKKRDPQAGRRRGPRASPPPSGWVPLVQRKMVQAQAGELEGAEARLE